MLIGKYYYDGSGKRVKKQTFDQYGQVKETTVFVYSSSKLVAEYSTIPPPTNPTTNYVVTDTLDSVRAISDSNGQVTSRRDFMPFGEELLPDATYRTTTLKYGSTDDKIRQKFTGYQKDEETNLDFAEARMYFNQHGRFTTIDPLLASGKSSNPQTFNRYIYAMNRLLILTDPSGMQAGKWYKPITPDGVKTYIYSSSQPKDYEEVTQRNSRGELIGTGTTLEPYQVYRFNPYGPGGYPDLKTAILDLAGGLLGGDPYYRNGYNVIRTDEAQRKYMMSGATENVSMELALTVLPAAQGAGSLLKSGTNMFRGGETFYRSMSAEAAETLMQTGKMPAGAGETMISPTKAFAANYDGALFKFQLNKGTTDELLSVGVRDAAANNPFKFLPEVSRGWKPTNAFFKVEGNQVNIGLGNGRALDIFNRNIRNFREIPK